MSLISDSLKTAQREKSRRNSTSAKAVSASILVPLRNKPRADFNWRRTLAFSGGGVAVVALGAVVWLRGQDASPLPAVPPVTSTILSEALAADPATARETVAGTRSGASVIRDSVRGTRSSSPPRVDSRTVARAAAARAGIDTFTVPQGQPRPGAATVASPPSPSAREVQSAGRLRIAVDMPRQPESARLFGEAVAAHRAGDLPTARSLYERVVVLAPNDADALNNLGVLLSTQRDFNRALDVLRRAASISPSNAGVWNNIGTVLRQQNRSSDAIAAYRHALTLDPNHQGAMVGLAQQYLAISAPAQARVLLEDVVAMNPALAEAQYTLGQVLELQNDRAGAIRAYSAFIELAPPTLGDYVEPVRRRVDALSRNP